MVTKVSKQTANGAVTNKKIQRVVDDPLLTAIVRQYAEQVWSIQSVDRVEAYLDGCALYVETVTNNPSASEVTAIYTVEREIRSRYPDIEWRGRVLNKRGSERISNAYTDLLINHPSK